MRISEIQKKAFIESIHELGIKNFDLYLFGSRTRDSAKGGDIDLLLFASKEDVFLLRNNKTILLTKMKVKSSDERIDLTFIPFEEKNTNAFLKTIPPDEIIKLN